MLSGVEQKMLARTETTHDTDDSAGSLLKIFG